MLRVFRFAVCCHVFRDREDDHLREIYWLLSVTFVISPRPCLYLREFLEVVDCVLPVQACLSRKCHERIALLLPPRSLSKMSVDSVKSELRDELLNFLLSCRHDSNLTFRIDEHANVVLTHVVHRDVDHIGESFWPYPGIWIGTTEGGSERMSICVTVCCVFFSVHWNFHLESCTRSHPWNYAHDDSSGMWSLLDSLVVSQNVRHVGDSSLLGSGAVIRFVIESEGSWWSWILDIWLVHRTSMILKKEDTTSDDSISLRISQQLVHASEKLQMTWREDWRHNRWQISRQRRRERRHYLILYSDIVGCIKKRSPR